jgi:deoxycytidylate deaminase
MDNILSSEQRVDEMNQNVINRATKTAQKSTVVRGRVGAVLFMQTGQVITAACNKTIHGKQDSGTFTAHAEERLLAKAHKLKAVSRFGIPNLSILVVRWKPSIKGLAMAKPCDPCAYYMREAGFRRIYYSDEDGNIVRFH